MTEKNNMNACCRRYRKAYRSHLQNPSVSTMVLMDYERNLLQDKIGEVATDKILKALRESIS